jgi:hypothetical protein
MVSSFRRARSAATDTNDDSYRFLNVFGGGDSHGSPEPERVSAGNKDLTKYMPRVTFVKLARRQRFTEILEILRREDEYDIDGWFFLEAPKTRFMFSLTALIPRRIASPHHSALPSESNGRRQTY